MFIELIMGPKRHDLLSLENLLASSVNVIAILLQSPGTFTELGAFANHKRLKDKLIVVIDPKYDHARSFINYGPIRYLRTRTKSIIISSPMDKNNFEIVVKKLADSAREISKHSFPLSGISNPVMAYNFYLSIIYVFEPIPREYFLKVSEIFAKDNRDDAKTLAEAVLSSLINERKATISNNRIFIAKKGIEDLIYSDASRKRRNQLSSLLTDLRLSALNLTLRKKYGRVWGEAR
jgi:hypothetical protein